MTTIDAGDDKTLAAFGERYWLDELQPLRGSANVPNELAAELRSTRIVGMSGIRIVSGLDFGCSREKAVILTMPTPDGIDGETLLEAVWAGYMLSLKATMDAGGDGAHIGDDEDAVDLAQSIVTRLGATATPSSEIYGSGGTFLENLDFRYNPESRTLDVDPGIGS